MPAVDITRPVASLLHILTQESHTASGMLLGTHPAVHMPAPLLNTFSAPQTTGTAWAVADKATKGSRVLM